MHVCLCILIFHGYISSNEIVVSYANSTFNILLNEFFPPALLLKQNQNVLSTAMNQGSTKLA